MPRRKRAAAASRKNGKLEKLAVAEPKAKPKSCFKLRGLAAVQHARRTFQIEFGVRSKAIHKILGKARCIQDILDKMRPPKKKRSKILREVSPCSPSMPLSPCNFTLMTSALPCPQRAHNKVQRLLDKADKLTDELDAERKLKSGPYAFGWSEKTGALFVRPWKRQLWIRDWWRKARRWGYRRPRGTYDDAAAKRRVEAAMAAEVAACLDGVIADVVSACSAPVARPKARSPRKLRRAHARAA